jgi:putative restriction endonuclease
MTLSPADLGDRLIEALEATGIEVKAETGIHERPLLLSASGEPLRVFLWNATPGGPPGVRADTEFRVQTTRPGGVAFLVADGRQSILLGYHEELNVFAAWDVRFHPDPGTSSSLQISLETLEEAAESGFASKSRPLAGGDEEVVIAFSPESIGTYLEVLPPFRSAVIAPSDAPLGEAITSGEDPAEEDLPGDQERRVASYRVARLVRDRRFRVRVIKAYGGKCAFCGIGLGLAEAAHIQAVRDGGPDVVSNGVCACPLHHRAFDRGFLRIDDDLRIEINRPLIAELGYREGEISDLESGLFEKLDAPASKRPAPVYLGHHRSSWTKS